MPANSDGTFTLVGGQVITRVHSPDQCKGEFCCLHNPSDHHMVDWPQNFRGDVFDLEVKMERICPHGIGHDDPDDLAFRRRQNPNAKHIGIHGCDGCCEPRKDA